MLNASGLERKSVTREIEAIVIGNQFQMKEDNYIVVHTRK